MNSALAQLGIGQALLDARGFIAQEEASDLQVAEIGEDGREFLLTPATTTAWHSMKIAAQQDGIVLLLVSAYRSVQRQIEIVQAKLDAGQQIADILTIVAPPGYSEHHTGRAIDIGSDEDTPELEVEFETTAAFAWLTQHANAFGFSMSYPKGNSSGYQYEPWHWCFTNTADPA
ncbi:M15 family metallopeptidase [Undibacterium terreum]|uniref:D-alanyl-D-alanine carboxypeptidase n=1 Tax=Undibacterium terreum TaxID=1224302 RepID=A0A916U5X5_9BURK|nr:M15 family metallopeptidase [Undibacterium terreum]GGC61064.1 D-alanyl-D-alanine carboxypeptidase [Undibacterium terreum]